MTDQVNPTDFEFWDDYQHVKREVLMLRDTEKRLLGVQARYNAWRDYDEDFVAVMDKDGRFLDVNPRGLALLGLSEKEIIEKKAEEVFPYHKKAGTISGQAVSAIRSNSEVPFTWEAPQKNGPTRLFRAKAAPIARRTGKPIQAVVIARDLTNWMSIRSEVEALQKTMTGLLELIDAKIKEP